MIINTPRRTTSRHAIKPQQPSHNTTDVTENDTDSDSDVSSAISHHEFDATVVEQKDEELEP